MSLKFLPILFRSYFIVIGIIGLVFSGQGLRAQDNHEQKEAITKLINDYQEARENSDAKHLARLLAEDADQLVSSGEWRKGKDDLVAGMQMSSKNNAGDRSITVDNIRFISDEVAIADAAYVIANKSTGTERRMWSTFVVKKEGNRWLISAIRNMLPARSRN
jgi:uncharacterized protein (TIGR02246 family)